MTKKEKAAESRAAESKAEQATTVTGYLPRDYRVDGKVYGPGMVEVPADSTLATFFTDPPTEEK